MELRNGTRLQGGKYTISRKLGQGTFGITYLAKARFTTESSVGPMEVEACVAIKEFFMSEVNSRSADGSSVEGSGGSVFTNYRRKFRKEAENLARLRHVGIVKIFEVFDENATTYYAMEFLDGLNLDDYIMKRGRLPERDALDILKEIGDALQYMHSCRMLHLDIKPKNIMRRTDGHNYLIDFGLSKQFTADGEPESSTTIGLGTPGYAPLEQAQQRPAEPHQFPATLDVYALGATLYKMLTGKRPPEATYVLNDGFPAARLEEAGVSARTVKAIRKAMAPVRKDRWASVDEFLSALGISIDSPKAESTSDAATPSSPQKLSIANTWRQRNWFVNIWGVGTLIAYLLFWFLFFVDGTLPENVVDYYVFFFLLTGIYATVKLLYGERRGAITTPCALFLLVSLLPLLGFSSGDTTALTIFALPLPLYLAVLQIRKNGKSAYSLLRSISGGFSNFKRWPLATRIVLCAVMLIFCAIFAGGLVSTKSISVLSILFVTPLIMLGFMLMRGRKSVLFIMYAIVITAIVICKNYFHDLIYESFGYLAILVILTLCLTQIRHRGHTAWEIMR